MKRPLSVALLSCCILVAVPAIGQRGAAGGHAGGAGGHFAAPPGRNFSGFSGSRGTIPVFSAPTFQVPRGTGFVSQGFVSQGGNFVSTPSQMVYGPGRTVMPYGSRSAAVARSWNGWREHGGSGRGEHGHYRPRYRGYGGYGGYANSWELLPWGLGYADMFGADESQTPPADSYSEAPYSEAPAGEEYAASQDPYRPAYGEAMAAPPGEAMDAPPPPADAAPVRPEPELTLIFRDGHQQTIHNYVLTSSTLIVLDQAASGRQQRIPLAELNLASTEQAARAAGLDFSPPA